MASNDSGTETLTLDRVLSDDLQLTIPDIQRDFCWGNARDDFDMSRASTFASGIMHLFSKQRSAVLGLVYGYEERTQRGLRLLHIIDGQQRITTLYLMLGMVYRKARTAHCEGAEKIKHKLMRGAPTYADSQPAIAYEAKKEVMYFLKDLSWNFFINARGRLDSIEKSDWFFRSYESEPSVQAMLGALRDIDGVLDTFQTVDWTQVATFMLYCISFTYCQLPSQEFAEGLFITINTTGEPLSLAQKLRSLHLTISHQTSDDARAWDEMEDWAWRNRSHGGDGEDACERLLDSIVTAHAGMCKLLGDQRAMFDLDSLYDFFKAYARVAECTHAAPSDFSTLPAIAYVMRFGRDASERHLSDFCNMLENITRYQRPTASGDDTRQAIAMAQGMPHPNIVSLLECKQAPRRLVNDEEREKLMLLASNPGQTDRVRDILRRAEKHPLLDGKVAQVIKWCQTQQDTDIDKLEQYIDRIYALWGTDIDKADSLDQLRKALLVLGHKGYPIVRRGDSVLSLCWHDYDWQRLMGTAPGAIRQLLDRAAHQSINDIVESFDDPTHPYQFIITDKTGMLARCRKRQLLRPCTPFIGYYDLGLQANVWHVGFAPALSVDLSRWKAFKPYGSRCIYTDSTVANIAIDLYWQPNERSEYRIEVFARPDSSLPDAEVKKIVEQYGNIFRYDRKRKRNFAYASSAHDAVALIQSLLRVHSTNIAMMMQNRKKAPSTASKITSTLRHDDDFLGGCCCMG